MGSFAEQQFVINSGSLIDGLALSGSYPLDGLLGLAQSGRRTPAEIVSAAFDPARTRRLVKPRPGNSRCVHERPFVFRRATTCC